MSRPNLPKNDLRTERLTLFLTQREYKSLQHYAVLTGETISVIVRRLIASILIGEK